MNSTNDSWRGGDPYEQFMGRWSRLIGVQFLEWLAAPPQKSWLDLGCGTGVLTQLMLERNDPAHVTAIDQSATFIAHVQNSLSDQRLTAKVGDALALDLPPDAVDLTVSAIAFNFFPDYDAALRQMRAVTKPGGTVAFYVWDYAGDMQMLRYFWDTATQIDPGARALDEGARFPVCAPDPLSSLLRAHQFGHIEVEALAGTSTFQDFDDYWTPFEGRVGPAPSYVTSLNPKTRTQLKERLRRTLPGEPDGTIQLNTRAWAIKGVVS